MEQDKEEQSISKDLCKILFNASTRFKSIESKEDSKSIGLYLLNCGRSILRGGLFGGIIGGLASGWNPKYTLIGAVAGVLLDTMQNFKRTITLVDMHRENLEKYYKQKEEYKEVGLI